MHRHSNDSNRICLGMLVAELQVTPSPGNWRKAVILQYRGNLATGKCSSNHSLQNVWQFIVADCIWVDTQFLEICLSNRFPTTLV